MKRYFPQRAYTLASIETDFLKNQGIQGVILDLDNTVVSEDDRYVSPNAEAWIAAAKRTGIQFFILSNGKRRYRVNTWSERLGIPAINPARKPFPPAFRKALKYMQLTPKQVVVIGDSLHTDRLGAWLIGCPFIQVASLPHPPRWWERLFGKWVQIPYPSHYPLWPLDAVKNYEEV
ncbi:MAG: YqeG family HAD IIIA-type phosphatase [Actinomycetota bacterium]